MNWDGRLTQAVADAICARSAAGEAVEAIIADLGLPEQTIFWLQACHRKAIEAAKQEQIRKREC